MIGAVFITVFIVFLCIVAGMVIFAITESKKLKSGELPSNELTSVIALLETAAILIVMTPLALFGFWIFTKVWWVGIIIIITALCMKKIIPFDNLVSCKIDKNKFRCEFQTLLFKNKAYERNLDADELDTTLKDYIEDSGLVHVQRVENPHINPTGSFKPTPMSKAFMASQRAAVIIKKRSLNI